MSREGKRRLVAVIAAVGVAAVVVGVILVVLVRHTPDFASVTEQPDPPLTGTIAYQTWAELEGGYPYGTGCLVTRPASGGATTQLSCDAVGENLAATPDGRIQAVFNTFSGSSVVLYDPTGAREPEPVTSRVTGARTASMIRDDGARVDVEGGDGRFRVVVSNDNEQRTVLTLEGPDDYYVDGAAWSPDGRWIVIGDSTSSGPRLLVVSAEGDPQPRILVDNAGLFPFAWTAAP